ncbi:MULTISPECIES: phosphatase PAP2 family protein [Streptomyces]|uniref:phosphatase PAP2 family protein n=1 Tax=Streptomyces TaxID=1883 RepID=UPI001602D107|nr:hypothetical protein [Streptomyces sp. gCLA4]
MDVLASLRNVDHRLTRRMAAWNSAWARQLLPPVEEAVEHTKLWWAVAVERVHSGAHYPSDVAVGAAVGMVAAALVRAVPRLFVRYVRLRLRLRLRLPLPSRG